MEVDEGATVWPLHSLYRLSWWWVVAGSLQANFSLYLKLFAVWTVTDWSVEINGRKLPHCLFFFSSGTAQISLNRAHQTCGCVNSHVSPRRPCRGVHPQRLYGLRGCATDHNGLAVRLLPLWRRRCSVDSRPWVRCPALGLTTQWDLSGLWTRRGWWRWSGRMEAAVCTPSLGSETTVSARCARWSRLRRGSCCFPALMSTRGSMLWSSPVTGR